MQKHYTSLAGFMLIEAIISFSILLLMTLIASNSFLHLLHRYKRAQVQLSAISHINNIIEQQRSGVSLSPYNDRHTVFSLQINPSGIFQQPATQYFVQDSADNKSSAVTLSGWIEL